MESEYKYFAFISYKREDEQWAKWLQYKLEHYHLPSKLRQEDPNLPKAIRPVFKDTSDLSAGNLSAELQEALERSKFLIVICSPAAARSPWVCKEVQTFVDLKRVEKIIPFIIDGRPHADDPEMECFPSALLSLSRDQELLAVNIHEMGRNASAIKVIARMLNLDFDALWMRYTRYQRRKNSLAISIISLLFFAISGISYWMWSKNKELDIVYRNVLDEQRKKDSLFEILQAENIHQTINLSQINLLSSNPYQAYEILSSIRQYVDIMDSSIRKDYVYLANSIRDSLAMQNLDLISVDTLHTDSAAFPQLPEKSLVQQGYFMGDDEEERGYLVDFEKFYETDAEMYSRELFVLSKYTKLGYVYDTDGLCLYRKSDSCCMGRNMCFSNNEKYVATFLKRDTRCRKPIFESEYSPEFSGVRIISLETGEVVRFAPCVGWYYQMSYPVAFDDSLRYLIYREGYRSRQTVFFVDFENKIIKELRRWSDDWDTSFSVRGNFSPGDSRYFFTLVSTYNDGSYVNDFLLYETEKQKLIHKSRFVTKQTVSIGWENETTLSIKHETRVDKLQIVYGYDKYNMSFKCDHIPTGVAVCDRYAAACCADNRLYVWDLVTRKKVYDKVATLNDMYRIEFSADQKSLWATSAYGMIAYLDLSSLTMSDALGEWLSDHPWGSTLTATGDGLYFIVKHESGHSAIVDVQRKKTFQLGRAWNIYYSKELSRLLIPYDDSCSTYDLNSGSKLKEASLKDVSLEGWEKIDVDFDFSKFNVLDYDLSDGRVMTAKRQSLDRKWTIESMVDGTIRVYATSRDQ